MSAAGPVKGRRVPFGAWRGVAETVERGDDGRQSLGRFLALLGRGGHRLGAEFFDRGGKAGEVDRGALAGGLIERADRRGERRALAAHRPSRSMR